MWLAWVNLRRSWTSALRPLAAIVAMTAAAAALAHVAERWLDPPSLSLFFVVPIVLAAIGFGLPASLGAALLSSIAVNFLFVEPRYTLVVARAQDAAALALFAIVGALVSAIAARARVASAARMEAARERFKSELLSAVSHDLRTPLATIVFTLQSLQRFASSHSPEEHDELLALAEREARRLAGLVDTLLDASRIESGAAPVHLEDTAIGDLAAAALSETRGEAGDIPVTARLPDDLPAVRADPVLAVRALANVLSNAFAHAAGSPVTIEARQEGDGVVIEVADRGPGLGENPERLFEKFTRGIEGDGRAPGLGLGLSLARGLLESQGAAIHARNRPGGGAVFLLRFPSAQPAHAD